MSMSALESTLIGAPKTSQERRQGVKFSASFHLPPNAKAEDLKTVEERESLLCHCCRLPEPACRAKVSWAQLLEPNAIKHLCARDLQDKAVVLKSP